MADGKIVTNWSLNTLHQTVTGKDIFNRIIFDLGAHYWIDQLRIIGEPIGAPPVAEHKTATFSGIKSSALTARLHRTDLCAGRRLHSCQQHLKIRSRNGTLITLSPCAKFAIYSTIIHRQKAGQSNEQARIATMPRSVL